MHIRHLWRVPAHLCSLFLAQNGEEEETLIGGQAVLEGVMMRAPHSYCVAVRKPSGEIATTEGKLPKISEKYPVFRFPVLRGLGTIGQALALGVKALNFSAAVSLEEEKPKGKAPRKELPSWMLALNLILPLAFFLSVFKFAPYYLATSLGTVLPAFQARIPFNLAEGAIKTALFVGFLFAISLWKDIRRVFEYHGAEHRVVFNFEAGTPVTVENAQAFPTFHPRCGTSFLMVIVLVSIVVYTTLPFNDFWLGMAGRIALLPLVAGISYEIIRWAAKHRGGVMAAVTAPGLWLQRITTKPPAPDQTEVAIRALEGAMALEQAQGGKLVIA